MKKRMFGQPRRGSCFRASCLTLALIVLAACAPRSENWSPAESPKHNLVSWAEFHHSVGFEGSAATLSTRELQALDQFTARLADGEGVRIILAAANGSNPELTMRREMAVATWFRERGLRPQLGTAPAGIRGGTVLVTVGRHVVTPPNCPDWTKPADGDPGNNVSSNFGCATAKNLGLMIADPGALTRGYPTGPADGEVSAKSVRNYRDNTIPWLPATAGFKIQGSTGGDSKSGSGN